MADRTAVVVVLPGLVRRQRVSEKIPAVRFWVDVVGQRQTVSMLAVAEALEPPAITLLAPLAETAAPEFLLTG
jgi:hypothetical protein